MAAENSGGGPVRANYCTMTCLQTKRGEGKREVTEERREEKERDEGGVKSKGKE